MIPRTAPTARRLLLRTFLIGWAVVGAAFVVYDLHRARGEIGAWIEAIAMVAIAPAWMVFVAVMAAIAGSAGISLGCAAIALVPVVLWRFGRRASPRQMIALACGLALWWLLLGYVGIVLVNFRAS